MNVGTLYRCSPNSEERRIWTFLEEKAYDFAEVYFDDLRLSKGSIAEKFLWLDYVNGGKEYSLPDSWEHQLDITNYSFKIGRLPKYVAGCVNHRTRTVIIKQEYEKDDVVLLHEMIHVFQGLYDYSGKPPMYSIDGTKVESCVFPFIRDALLVSLYTELKSRIDDLDERILAHANIHSGVKIAQEGGNHDILFFLKSLDVDLRCGYTLGTVCGYGRTKF